MALVGTASGDRAFVIDDDGSAASRVDGSWVPKIQFSFEAMSEEFSLSPPDEAEALLKAARM